MERNLSREAHLWYTITSPEYTDRAREHLQAAVNIMIPQAKARPFIADYAPVPYWGGRMEDLLRTYANARALLVQGGYGEMIGWEGRLGDIPRGLQEGNLNWLGADADVFMDELNAACSVCSPFGFALTMSQMFKDDAYKVGQKDWRVCVPEDMGIVGDHITFYYEDLFSECPADIPEYIADKTVSCKTGDIVPWTGVWVPADGMGKAALAFARKHIQIMQPAYHLIREDKDTGDEEYDVVECTWHPVKPTGRMIPFPGPFRHDEEEAGTNGPLRCPGGQPCPQAGFWSTPADINSRRRFAQGEIMPALGGDYGATIWQREYDQT